MAEAHPVGFRWVMKAQASAAPRSSTSTRASRAPSAMADMHVPIRAGTDIAFLGGLIRHVLETESLLQGVRRSHYTNAATIINEEFQDTEDLGGFFSGFDPETGDLRPRRPGCTRAARSRAAAGMREHADAGVRASSTGAGHA